MPKEVPMYAQRCLSLIVLLLLSGCANHFTFSQQHDLASSKSVFLEPTSERTVYLEVRNSSNNAAFHLDPLETLITQKGYTITNAPQEAHILLQANTVFCDESKLGMTADTLIAAGWGGTIGAAGGVMAAIEGASSSFIPGLGIAGAALGAGASKLSEDTIFLCATDVQLTERTETVVEQTITEQMALGSNHPARGGSILSHLFTGSSGTVPSPGQSQETVTETLKGKTRRHKTRLVASAQRMWLDIEDATNALSKELSQGIANLLP